MILMEVAGLMFVWCLGNELGFRLRDWLGGAIW